MFFEKQLVDPTHQRGRRKMFFGKRLMDPTHQRGHVSTKQALGSC
jgi:hypothetical protein